MAQLWRMIVEVGVSEELKSFAWKKPCSYRTEVLIIADTQEYAEIKGREWWEKEGKMLGENGHLFSFGRMNSEMRFIGVEKVSCYGTPDVYLI